MSKLIMTMQVNKDISCDKYIGQLVINGLGETVGKVIKAEELDECIELTMEVETPIPLAKPLMQSFEIGGK